MRDHKRARSPLSTAMADKSVSLFESDRVATEKITCRESQTADQHTNVGRSLHKQKPQT